jgi:hypothetical protein
VAGYWTPVLLGALGVVALLALVVIATAHLRRLTRVLARYRSSTEYRLAPLRTGAAELRARRNR